MKKLEDKIIDRVYVFETKKTLLSAVIKIVSIGMLVIATSTFALVIIETLNEKETFSVIDIFQENLQAVHTYLLDVVYVFFVEIPKLHALFFIVGLFVLVAVLWVFVKNMTRIRNKVRSLLRYWNRKPHRE